MGHFSPLPIVRKSDLRGGPTVIAEARTVWLQHCIPGWVLGLRSTSWATKLQYFVVYLVYDWFWCFNDILMMFQIWFGHFAKKNWYFFDFLWLVIFIMCFCDFYEFVYVLFMFLWVISNKFYFYYWFLLFVYDVYVF